MLSADVKNIIRSQAPRFYQIPPVPDINHIQSEPLHPKTSCKKPLDAPRMICYYYEAL